LERRRLVRAEWGASENNRKAKFYELTAAGRARLAQQTSSWRRHVEAIAGALAVAAPSGRR
jgi:DNA-binding PadR family transcriptional regulator